MTKSASRRIGASEWIQEYFSPVVGVLGSEEAEALCRKNNLSLVEMLQPFTRVNEHLTVKDPEGLIHNVPTLNVTLQVNANNSYQLLECVALFLYRNGYLSK